MSSKKSDGFKIQTNNNANASNNRQQSSKLQRQTSVIPTFFRWFKKPNHRKQQFHSARSAIEPSLNRYDSCSRESLNFNSSQNYLDNHLSPSLSCDSVVSTSTTGFAFIKPNKYGNLVEPKILSEIQKDTNSIRRLNKSNNNLNTSLSSSAPNSENFPTRTPKLTLREKYFLFESDTLKSTASTTDSNLTFKSSSEVHGNYDNITDIRRNQYNQENIYVNDKEPIVPSRRHRSRRTVSDSSKELQSGAYVHVKGKRKAPDPPSNTNSIIIPSVQNSNPFEESYIEPLRDNYRTLSPVSTYGRKKRKAPPPPLLVELQTSKLNYKKEESQSPSIRKKVTPPKYSIAEEIIVEPANKIEIKITKSISEISTSNKGSNDIKNLLNKSETKIYSSICEAGVNQSNYNTKNLHSTQINNNSNLELNNSNKNLNTSSEKMPLSPLKHNVQSEIRSPIKTSNKESYPEHLKLTNHDPDITNESSVPTPPQSPISPRPWYKRPVSTNKESVIPFKREVVLKTIEKRKSKQKESPDSGLPEVSFSRSSIFDSTNKFSLFSRQKDTKNSKEKEKRLSNINMPNISELDREAAEILMNESKQTNWNENKSYNPPEHLKLHQEMFGTSDDSNKEISKTTIPDSDNNNNNNKTDIEEVSQSAKDLINKFEIQTEGPKVTINPSYIGKTECFVGNSKKSNKCETNVEENKQTVQKNNIEVKNDSKIITNNKVENNTSEQILDKKVSIENKIIEKSDKAEVKLLKLTWSCPYCTLENPNWRIICEVCEHIKPYEKSSEEENKNQVQDIKKSDISKLTKILPTSPQSHQPSAKEWEWKTEIVKKYFQKQDSTEFNETPSSINTPKIQSILSKSPSPSRLPITSPKLSRNERTKEIIKDYNKESNYQIDKNDISSINLEQIRVARLAKFSIPSLLNKEIKKTNSVHEEYLNDPNLLEMEKQRLREKIRAMNAKALAEKYPIVKKSISLDDPTLDPPITSESECCNENKRPISAIINIDQLQLERMSEKINKIENENDSKMKLNSIQEAQSSLNANENILNVQDENMSKKKETKLNSANGKNNSNYINISSPHPKSGAIKKVFTKNSNTNIETNLSNKTIYENNPQQIKPNKVSSSCQTSGLVKKTEDKNLKSNISLNALISPIKGHKYRNDDFQSNNQNLNHLKQEHTIQYQKLSEFDKEQVKEISKKLTSAEGRNNFKMTLDENKGKGLSRTDTLVLNKVLRNLEQAISDGKHELAAKLAMDLAKMKVSLQVTKLKPKKSHSFDQDEDQTFIVDMFIEDRISQKGPIQISIRPSMTVRELKEKAFKSYNIPVQLQRWIINDELLYNENLTLYECGVKNNLANLYLYLLTPQSIGEENNNINYKFTIPRTSKAFQEDDFSDQNSTDSLELADNANQKGAISLSSNPNSKLQLISNNPNNLNKTSKINNETINKEELPWECPLCTLINNSMALSCSACSKTKPLKKDEKSSISAELRKFLKGENLNNMIEFDQKSKLSNLRSKNENSNNSTTTTITITSSNNNRNHSNNNNNNSTSDSLLLNKSFYLNNKDNNKKVLLRPNEQKNDLNKTTPNRKSTEIYNIVEEVIKPVPGNLSEIKTNPNQEYKQRVVTVCNFSSPNITKNKYRGVDNFNPYRKDTNDIFQNQSNQPLQNITEKLNFRGSAKDILQSTVKNQNSKNSNFNKLLLKTPYSTNHYLELVKLDYSDVVQNFESFDCPICFRNIKHGDGIILRECLHTFCKECLADTIKFNEEAQVKCPYMDKEYSCNSLLQEREVKSLVTKEIYEKHLAKSIKLAEHHIENAFHCKTANCRGWCIYEDNVNEFLCPVCNLKNCLTCGAIHDGITCKQYQDGLNDCDSNEDAKRTKEMFQEMVQKGEALNCPTCQVIMMKKWGCDWLKCSMCKTEVCWVTKGPRWGPAGKGDTSGGCKCGVNGLKCHPKCNYCH